MVGAGGNHDRVKYEKPRFSDARRRPHGAGGRATAATASGDPGPSGGDGCATARAGGQNLGAGRSWAWQRPRAGPPSAISLIQTPQPLSFAVAGAAAGHNGAVGDRLVASEDRPLAVRFSDGSEVTVPPQAKAQVEALDTQGATVAVEGGTVEVSVVHRAKTRWQVRAGRYRIHVTGTRFAAGWDPNRRSLTVTMREGSVLVSGPGIAEPIPVVGGQRLRIRDEQNGDARRISGTPSSKTRGRPKSRRGSARGFRSERSRARGGGPGADRGRARGGAHQACARGARASWQRRRAGYEAGAGGHRLADPCRSRPVQGRARGRNPGRLEQADRAARRRGRRAAGRRGPLGR